MNNLKIKIYKTILKEVAEKYDRAKDFTNNRIDEICSQEKLSTEEVIYFLAGFLQFKFSCQQQNSFLDMKYKKTLIYYLIYSGSRKAFHKIMQQSKIYLSCHIEMYHFKKLS